MNPIELRMFRDTAREGSRASKYTDFPGSFVKPSLNTGFLLKRLVNERNLWSEGEEDERGGTGDEPAGCQKPWAGKCADVLEPGAFIQPFTWGRKKGDPHGKWKREEIPQGHQPKAWGRVKVPGKVLTGAWDMGMSMGSPQILPSGINCARSTSQAMRPPKMSLPALSNPPRHTKAQEPSTGGLAKVFPVLKHQENYLFRRGREAPHPPQLLLLI